MASAWLAKMPLLRLRSKVNHPSTKDNDAALFRCGRRATIAVFHAYRHLNCCNESAITKSISHHVPFQCNLPEHGPSCYLQQVLAPEISPPITRAISIPKLMNFWISFCDCLNCSTPTPRSPAPDNLIKNTLRYLIRHFYSPFILIFIAT